jgi:hypothetical protein
MDNKNKKYEIDLAIEILCPQKMMSPQKKEIKDTENSKINSNGLTALLQL